MSEENKVVSDEPEVVSEQQTEEKQVSAKAYQGVTKDLHKFKNKARELEQSLTEYQIKLKQIEEEKLKEQERWKELYEKTNTELESQKQAASQQQQNFLKSVKMAALKDELGGKIKDIYLSHASLDRIEFNDDGSIEMSSLHEVANDFRKEHGQLIPNSENVSITSKAPGSVDSPSSDSDLSNLSREEKMKRIMEIRQSKRS